jgi:hypothetical protein
MRITVTILILLMTKMCFGQDKIVGIYNDRFSESIELKADSTFIHNYRFDLSSSWTIGKWKISKDTLYLKTELVLDTLNTITVENKITNDSLVLSSDFKPNRITIKEYAINSISGGGQNRVKPPTKLYWKRRKLYRINENGTLDLRKLKAFWTDKKYKTYFTKETE